MFIFLGGRGRGLASNVLFVPMCCLWFDWRDKGQSLVGNALFVPMCWLWFGWRDKRQGFVGNALFVPMRWLGFGLVGKGRWVGFGWECIVCTNVSVAVVWREGWRAYPLRQLSPSWSFSWQRMGIRVKFGYICVFLVWDDKSSVLGNCLVREYTC